MNDPCRTILLGLDGIDARFARVLMDAGLLPNLGALADGYGFRRVLSTTPAESAVAWTSFNLGANPGRTNVFDFIERSAHTYVPRLAGTRTSWAPTGPSAGMRWGATVAAGGAGIGLSGLTSRRLTRRAWLRGAVTAAAGSAAAAAAGVPLLRWLPRRGQRVVSEVDGEPWWDRAAHRGERSVAARIPVTYPARARPEVRLLAGLGVPDAGGTNGTYRVLTDTPAGVGLADRFDRLIHLSWGGDDSECLVRIPGPEDGLEPARQAMATLGIRRAGVDAVVISACGESQTVRRGAWSTWIPLAFDVSPIASQRGVARLHFRTAGPGVTLYLTAVELDPARPPVRNPVSSPPAFAEELCAAIGRYRTIGWETQTAGLIDDVLDESAYLADVHSALDGNAAQLDWLLGKRDWDQMMFVVQATDQASHVFFDASAVAMRDGGAVDANHPLVGVYRRADRIVGRVAAAARERGCRLVVMSDHGFAPYRRAVNLNTFLAQQGWLALRDRRRWDPADPAAVLAAEPWSNVDWFNTRAFAVGLAGVYLNVAGREAGGIVKRDGEYEFLQDKLAAALLGWCDPATGRRVFANVYRAQDIYQGPHAGNGPDLVLGFNEGFRVSSSSAVGASPPEPIVDNPGHWVADHCGIDAPLIPGICLTNFKNDWPDLLPIETLAGRIWPRV